MNLKEVLLERNLYTYFENIKNPIVRNSLLNKCKLKKYKKGEIFHFNAEGDKALIFLDGKYNLRFFVSLDSDYVYTGSGEFWLGIPAILDEEEYEFEVSLIEDTNVLIIPLKELLYLDPSKNANLWIKVMEISAKRVLSHQSRAIDKVALSTKECFLKELVENNYAFLDTNVVEIANAMRVNSRTLQRTVVALEKMKLIERDINKKYIKAISRDSVDAYLKNINFDKVYIGNY